MKPRYRYVGVMRQLLACRNPVLRLCLRRQVRESLLLQPHEEVLQCVLLMTYVVTIVHGTVPLRWLTDSVARVQRKDPSDPSAWARPDSPLGKGLVTGLKGDVVFSVFSWSGANSARARDEAAERLQHHLEDLMRRHHTARHVVIAHSHGGNVALRALRGNEIKTRLTGVVCLGTPFIVVVDRAGWLLPAYVAMLYACGAVGLVAALGAWWAHDWLALGSGQRPIEYLYFAAVAFVLGLGALVGTFVNAAHKAADRWKRRLALPDLTWLGCNRLLIIRNVGDEANSFLSSAQFVAWGAGGLIRRAAVLVGVVHSWLERPFRNTKYRVVKLAGYAVAACALLTLALTAGLLLLPIMALLVCASAATWGVGLGLLSPLIELSAESTPLGTWQTMQLKGYQRGDWVDLFGTELTTLAHSTVYADARAIARIVDWMTEIGATSQPTTEGL